MADILQQIASNLYNGEAEEVASLVQKALDQGMPPSSILSGGLITGMDEVGRDFKAGDLFVPEVLIAARAMHAGMNVLRPLLSQAEAAGAGKFVIGTVKGDLHDIGKNLVASMLEGAGFEVIDLGTDVSPAKFVAEAQSKNANIVALSALLTTTMPSMRTTIEEFQRAAFRDKVKIMIGGAPVTQQFAEQIGADGYSDNANGAVAMARRLAGA